MTQYPKVGIYPGTFDPVHEGHVAFALAAQRALHLDTVVFLPEANPRYKPNVSGIHHRLAMLDHAVRPYTGLSTLVLEESHFSVGSTLPVLQKQFPGAHLALLMGSDVALSLPHWPRISTLLSAMDIVVGMRADGSMAVLDEMFKKISDSDDIPLNPSYITADQASLCSTDIRAGHITHSHTAIASYIASNNLYQK